MIRRINGPLFLLALLIAVVIKVAVHEALQLTETTVTAQVRYNPPEGAMTVEPLADLKVRLRGERSEILSLNPFNVVVEVPIDPGELGVIDVGEERMRVRRPGDIEVLSIEPNRFALLVEEVVTRTVPVRVVVTGEPAAGAYHEEIRVRPGMALIEGPGSRVREIDELVATVSLDNRALTFDKEVPLVAPDPLVRVKDPRQVVIHVPMKVPGSESLDALLEPATTEADASEETGNSSEETG